jgi:hypothetical protein
MWKNVLEAKYGDVGRGLYQWVGNTKLPYGGKMLLV